ncbi:MAG: type II toxin-antitoxin system VapC family toxin [Pseudomonadota bacterium]|nr:type II toxin-antitoxin system VapC family toxin [Pseudomonadota bacterium]MDP1903062.1 type II toxin-antitoxin system VapC family toxin [Pseudomonadota bacterium]MDP2353051.1 type II toxin-antitoxin system VapC family toxin [Pseudomonadota bacterium]
MKILLDTCAFLWLIRGRPEASPIARALFSDAGNTIYLSSVSAWEIAVKHRLGKLPLGDVPVRYVPSERDKHGVEALPLLEADTLVLDKLPVLHNDPFDRMLICQAISQQMTLLTPDPLITQYPVLTRW